MDASTDREVRAEENSTRGRRHRRAMMRSAAEGTRGLRRSGPAEKKKKRAGGFWSDWRRAGGGGGGVDVTPGLISCQV